MTPRLARGPDPDRRRRLLGRGLVAEVVVWFIPYLRVPSVPEVHRRHSCGGPVFGSRGVRVAPVLVRVVTRSGRATGTRDPRITTSRQFPSSLLESWREVMRGLLLVPLCLLVLLLLLSLVNARTGRTVRVRLTKGMSWCTSGDSWDPPPVIICVTPRLLRPRVSSTH